MKILITGTSRGIGYELTSAALAAGNSVYAVARNTAPLNKLKAEFPDRLTLLEIDISKVGGIDKLVREITSVSGKNGALDILINNAGTMAKGENAEDLANSFWVNATVPFLLTKALLPTLMKSNLPRVAQISTMMASIADNTSGGYYAYRSSKTALNMLTRILAIDFPEVSFALIHPGWVKTDMGGANAPTEVVDSVRGMWKVISEMTLKNSGQYVNFKGETLPW